jgi:hypothetical protein
MIPEAWWKIKLVFPSAALCPNLKPSPSSIHLSFLLPLLILVTRDKKEENKKKKKKNNRKDKPSTLILTDTEHSSITDLPPFSSLSPSPSLPCFPSSSLYALCISLSSSSRSVSPARVPRNPDGATH